MADRIGKLARPKAIYFADDLPKTRSGKIMRRLLRDIADGKGAGGRKAPATRPWSRSSGPVGPAKLPPVSGPDRPAGNSDRLSANPEERALPGGRVGRLLRRDGDGRLRHHRPLVRDGEVMDVGGYCAEGGPYVVRQHCPDGAELADIHRHSDRDHRPVYRLVGRRQISEGRGRAAAAPGWPALFISLGYNFIDYAINPPEGMGSTAGWWVQDPFVLMGLPAPPGYRCWSRRSQPERRRAVWGRLPDAAAAGRDRVAKRG